MRQTIHATIKLCHTLILQLVCLNAFAVAPADSTQRPGVHQQLSEIRTQHNIPVLAYAILQPTDAHRTVRTDIHLLGGDRSTLMRWGSITKTITALTLIAVCEAQQIDLRTPVRDVLPSPIWTNEWATTHPIQLIHLLELTAGLPELSGHAFNFNEPLSLAQALAVNPGHRTTRWPPGRYHSYSNLTPGITQAVIEHLSKLPYADAVAKFVFKPVGMTHAHFAPAPQLPGGFKADGRTEIPYWNMTYPAFGALNAPVSDMARLAKAIWGREPGLSELQRTRLLQHASTPAQEVGFNFEYAAGFYPRIRSGHVWWGHGGDADGYRSRLSLLNEHDMGYIVVINTDNPQALREAERVLESYLVQQAQVNPSQSTQPQSHPTARDTHASLAHLVGTYKQATSRFGKPNKVAELLLAPDTLAESELAEADTQFSYDDSTEPTFYLLFRQGSRTTTLYPTAAGLFRRATDPVATVAMVSSEGKIRMQGVLGNYEKVSTTPTPPE